MAGRAIPLVTTRFAAILLAVALVGRACGAAATPVPDSSSPGASPSGADASGGTGGPSASATASAGSTAGLDCSALVATPELTEGPYFTPGSPEKTDLREPGMAGTTLVVSGYVVTADCRPVAGAVIDVWQADSTGTYDNSGYTLRGHLVSADDGGYTFTTVVPGIYPGRTEHIHVKVTPPGGSTLTTQLFFPGVSQNDADGIYDPAAQLAITETADGLAGWYVFVL